MKKYILYCRKSTNDSKHQQYSLSAQEKICKEYAKRNNLPIVEILIEMESAKDAGKRPLFLKMLHDLEAKKYDGVITHKVDRLLRSIGDYALVDDLKNKTEFIFAEGDYKLSNPDSAFSFGINVLFAKKYVENLSQEVKKGMQEAVEQGKLPLPAPLGYASKGKGEKIVVPSIADLIKETFELYLSGDYSLDELTDTMQRKGLKTKKERVISCSTIHYILQNPFYYGEMRYKGELYPGQHKPIIKKALFVKVQKLLDSKNTGYQTKKPYAYRGLIKCANCGGTLSPVTKKGHVYYYCTNKKCNESTTREDKIEEYIGNVIDGFRFTENDLKEARKAMIDIDSRINKERDSKLKVLRLKEANCVVELDKVRALVIKNVFTEEEFKKERDRLNEELEQIRIELDAYMEVDKKRLDEVYNFLELAKNAPVLYKHGTMKEKRELVKLAFLELNIEGKKLASYKLKPEFDILEKRHVIQSGGPGWT
jgi:site-specific DNA recombinase